jgi:hypothetical protein
MQYTWTVKHLNSDRRGYASDGYFELEGVNDDGKKYIGSAAVSFGGDDLKPISAWQQSDIDAYAETLRSNLEAQIESQLNGASA